MKKFFKAGGYVAGAILLVALAALTYFNMTYPRVNPAPDIKVQVTPARLARGEYLVNHVVGCADCHSERDWTKYAGPLVPGTEGKGGEKFDRQTAGVPGIVYAKNITPAGMTDRDLGAMYAYLRTLKPIHHKVGKFTPEK